MFRVGQKVVCICDTWRGCEGLLVPKKGTLYTVRELNYVEGDNAAPWGIRLFEIVNPTVTYLDGVKEAAFTVEAFRPLVEKKTDIGFAHEILRKATKKERV